MGERKSNKTHTVHKGFCVHVITRGQKRWDKQKGKQKGVILKTDFNTMGHFIPASLSLFCYAVQ